MHDVSVVFAARTCSICQDEWPRDLHLERRQEVGTQPDCRAHCFDNCNPLRYIGSYMHDRKAADACMLGFLIKESSDACMLGFLIKASSCWASEGEVHLKQPPLL